MIRFLEESDIDEMVSAFKAIGWHKPRSIYEGYLSEQTKGTRLTLIAKKENRFCGYVTLKWNSDYPHFKAHRIPEIADLNVLPHYRKKGIGSKLIEKCEKLVVDHGYTQIGLGMGLTKDYGNAQRLYVKRGFILNGHGLFYKHHPVHFGTHVIVDDDLVLYLTKTIKSRQ